MTDTIPTADSPPRTWPLPKIVLRIPRDQLSPRGHEVAALVDSVRVDLENAPPDRRPPLDHLLALLGAEPSEANTAAIERHCRELRSAVHLLATPARSAARPQPVMWLELATDLGLDLPADGEIARVVIQRSLDAAIRWDRRADPVARAFRAAVVGGVPIDNEVRRLRHALAGSGLPSVRPDDAVFAAPREVLAPPLTACITSAGASHPWARVNTTRPPEWYLAIARDLGLAVPPIWPGRQRLEQERQEATDKAARHLRARSSMGRQDSHELAELAEAQAAIAQRFAKLAGDDMTRSLTGFEAVRVRIVDAVDQVLEDLEQRELGTLRCFLLREVRHALAFDGEYGRWSRLYGGADDLWPMVASLLLGEIRAAIANPRTHRSIAAIAARPKPAPKPSLTERIARGLEKLVAPKPDGDGEIGGGR